MSEEKMTRVKMTRVKMTGEKMTGHDAVGEPVSESPSRSGKNANRKTGSIGERLASHHLETLGYRVLARNLRVGRLGELDLVAWAEDGRTLCFVEVKTRTSERYGTPAEAVSVFKRKRIRKMAEAWLACSMSGGGAGGRSLQDIPLRFDVVEVMLDRENHSARVHHIPGAF